jgi:hypothetical protein
MRREVESGTGNFRLMAAPGILIGDEAARRLRPSRTSGLANKKEESRSPPLRVKDPIDQNRARIAAFHDVP